MVMLLVFIFILVVLLLITLTLVFPTALRGRGLLPTLDNETQAARQLREIQKELDQKKLELEEALRREEVGKETKERLDRRVELLEKQLENAGNKQAQTQRALKEAGERLRVVSNELEKVQAQKVAVVSSEDGQLADGGRLAVVEARLAEARKKIDKMLGEDLLVNTPWLKLATNCVELFDDLEKRRPSFDRSRQELIMYVCSQMELMLERAGVEVITDDATFDEKRHRIEAAKDRVEPGAEITETLSPGFMVGTRILRRAHVQVS